MMGIQVHALQLALAVAWVLQQHLPMSNGVMFL
jgi:hypothetical protein